MRTFTRFRKKHLLLVLVATIVSGMAMIRFIGANSIRQNIESGELAYTCNCGWVDWGHARPDGVRSLIRQVVIDSSSGEGTRTVAYSQRMTIRFLGKSKLVAEITRHYLIRKGTNRKKREEMAYAILMETSGSFENMQGSFPFNMNLGARRSSFKDGDLSGNNIAYYRALRGYSKQEIVSMCNVLSKDSSLKLLEAGKFGRSFNWQPHLWLPNGNMPEALEELQADSISKMTGIKFLRESKKIYFDF